MIIKLNKKTRDWGLLQICFFLRQFLLRWGLSEGNKNHLFIHSVRSRHSWLYTMHYKWSFRFLTRLMKLQWTLHNFVARNLSHLLFVMKKSVTVQTWKIESHKLANAIFIFNCLCHKLHTKINISDLINAACKAIQVASFYRNVVKLVQYNVVIQIYWNSKLNFRQASLLIHQTHQKDSKLFT